MELNVIQQMMLDTGMLEIKLPVKHDVSPENEIAINPVWCDIGSHKVSEWQMQGSSSILFDAAVCEDCYEHYN